MDISETLYSLFMKLPPNLEEIKQILENNRCTRECVSETFCKFSEECFCEYSEFIVRHNRKPLDEEIHSTYIFPLCELLLKYGLDPNHVFGEKFDESNIMYQIYWIDKPYVAADTLKILLENGGNPLLEVDNESIWHLSDFDIWFDVLHRYAQREDYMLKFDSRFHFWLVLRGFLSNKDETFKEHSLYTYNLVQIDKDNWDLQIIQKIARTDEQ